MTHLTAIRSTLIASVEGRQLLLADGDKQLLSISLDEGGRHRLVVADVDSAQRVLETLDRCAGVGVLVAGGGMLGAMTVAENFTLALRYDAEPEDSRDWERELESALRLCGMSPQRLATLGRERPMHLERSERWVLGFARWLLRPPELLVMDRLFTGQTRRQADALIAVEAIYHQRHPFRPVLFLDLDSHELPDIPDCRTVTELVESRVAPCLC